MKNRFALFLLLFALPAGLFAAYQNAGKAEPAKAGGAAAAPAHVTVAIGELKWTPLFAGLERTVVSGDPSKAGEPYVLRIRATAAAVVPAHWHPNDENVTVLSGTFKIGMGDRYDEKALHTLTAGGFAMMPKEVRHFAFYETGAETQIHGMGPFLVNFVNPDEDPRKAATK